MAIFNARLILKEIRSQNLQAIFIGLGNLLDYNNIITLMYEIIIMILNK